MVGDYLPGAYAIRFKAGNRYERTFAFGPEDDPVVLTGVAVKLQAVAGGLAVLTATDANGLLTLNGPAGTVAVNLPPTLTAALTPGIYPYDFVLTFPGADPETWLSATLQVLDSFATQPGV